MASSSEHTTPPPLSPSPATDHKRSHEEMEKPDMASVCPASRESDSSSKTEIQDSGTKETEQPPTSQAGDTDHAADRRHQTPNVDDEEGFDPADDLPGYDWGELEQRFGEAMAKCDAEFASHEEEWAGLVQLFKIWAAAGNVRDNERSYKRLKTRVMHVQNSEQHFERTREHYINVVNAFESALKLLNTLA